MFYIKERGQIMVGNLEYYNLRIDYEYWGKSKGFVVFSEYLKVGKKNGCILLLNGGKEIIPIPNSDFNQYFILDKTIAPIETAIYVGNDINIFCEQGEKYSIYKKRINSKKQKEYFIINDTFDGVYLSEDDFLTEEEANKDSTCLENIKGSKEEINHLNFLKDCFNLLNKELLPQLKPQKKSWWKKLFNSDESETNLLLEYQKVKRYNQLPYQILGKVKYIENEIFILECQDYSKEILNLLKKNINLTLLIAFESEKEQIGEKINSYLDTTIDYINSLKLNKELFDEEVELKVVDEIINIIDDNETIMKELIKVNKETWKDRSN